MTYILTIAGSDTLSGGGMQTDLATFKKNNLFGFVAITSIVTVENREYQVHEIPNTIFKQELNTLKDVSFSAIKIGLIPSIEKMKIIADFLENYPDIPIVIDPVLVFKEENDKKVNSIAKELIGLLLPKATLITPNLKEAEILCSQPINSLEDMENACKKIVKQNNIKNVLIKGGERLNTTEAIDLFFNGNEFTYFKLEKLNKEANGSGCMLASDITSYLAKDYSLKDAIEQAKYNVFNAIKNGNFFGVNP